MDHFHLGPVFYNIVSGVTVVLLQVIDVCQRGKNMLTLLVNVFSSLSPLDIPK